MNWKQPIIVIAIIAIVLFALYAFWSYPFYPLSGPCHFGVVASLNHTVGNPEDAANLLTANDWNLTDGFDRNQISEVNFDEKSFPVAFIEDKNIRYWAISAYKNGVGRVDLIDENGRLYKFYNCV